ncbi:MAG: phosphotransferase [Alphaproteobacteria bacterium]|nr:phosphotransferase [Alphaproteobacteria bacterium]
MSSFPAYLLRTAERNCVYRRKPPGTLLPSAHALNCKYRVLSALSKACITVPKSLLFVGPDFYMMERVPGRVFHDSSLPGVSTAERRARSESAAETLTMLHALDVEELGFSNFGRQENYSVAARYSKKLKKSHLAFALFRNALIFGGIAARAELRNAAAPNAGRVGRISRNLAKRAVAIVQQG